jgi:triacylglycerol lipase
MHPTNQRNPVLLVHGIMRTSAVFRKMSAYLTKRGWSVYSLNLIPPNATIGLDQLATQVADYVHKKFAPEQPLDLVGLSMGGLVARYYVQRLGGINKVQRLITISAPNQGTRMAYLSARPGCIQMRPGSAFLKNLNQDSHMLKRLNFTSLWTPLDCVIIPAKSSQMPVGKEVKIPVMTHYLMVRDNRTIQTVALALSEPLTYR